ENSKVATTEMHNDPSKIETKWEKHDKEYNFTHPHHTKFTNKIFIWIKTPFNYFIYDTNKDPEFGKYAWNSNGEHGPYPNRLASILYRTKNLQKRWLSGLFRWLDNRSYHTRNLADE